MTNVRIIGGCGHVGLPLGLALARAGHNVVAYDIDSSKVKLTNAGSMPFRDRGAEEVLACVLSAGTFRCTTDAVCLADAEVVISVVGTPVDEHLNPRLDSLMNSLEECREHLRQGQLLVIRSTVYPGATELVNDFCVRSGLGLDVAFCPERVAEGVALEEIATLPQIVSGASERAEQRAAELFETIASRVIRTTPRVAELTKLFTNSWRYVQFAVANQFFMIAHDFDVDFYDIYQAMTDGYPRASSFPRAGFAAGPCLFKDTMQLAAFHNHNFFLGHSAMLVNEGLPDYLVRRVVRRWPLDTMTAGLLGMTFKANSDDTRDSLSFKLRRLLRTAAADVLCHDPFLDEPWLTPLDEILERADIVFLGAPHSEYRDIEFRESVPVIDPWNALKQRTEVL